MVAPGVLKTVYPDGMGAGLFLFGQYDPNKSAEEIVLKANAGNLKPGTVLGELLTGAATVTVTATAGNTGTGTMAATPTVDAGAPAGDYWIEITDVDANAGEFRVMKPDGTLDGTGDVAAAYNGSINFTLQDATDFIVGDTIKVNVAYADPGTWQQYDQDGTNGTAIAAGILFEGRDTLAATQKAVAVVRDQVVNGNLLVWPSDITDNEKAAAVTQLKALGIIVRM